MFMGHFFMWPFMLLGIALQWGFWLFVIGGIVWAVRQRRRHLAPSDYGAPAMPRPHDPVEILRERYARGEIDTEQFDEMVSLLIASDPHAHTHPSSANPYSVNDPRIV